MARPTTIDDGKLLDAAREVFLEKGIAATTAEVAARAGVAQGSIFKRFRTKHELFLAAMRAAPGKQRWTELLERRTAEAGLREALVELGVTVLEFLKGLTPLIVMAWSNRGEVGIPKDIEAGKAGPYRHIPELVAVFEREMRAGRLRKHDAWLVARLFVGAMQSYALFNLVFARPLGPPIAPDAYVRGVVDVLWAGIAPPGREARR